MGLFFSVLQEVGPLVRTRFMVESGYALTYASGY